MKEVNFDGLVGPTHHYAGLAYGNLASMEHFLQTSNPKAAALEGLNKMKRVMDLGIPQAVLPPPLRPSMSVLRTIGFSGSDAEVLEKAAKDAPELLWAVSSASAMWRANSATVIPSCDSHDGRVHLTIANLRSAFHRSIEAEETLRLFQFLFSDPNIFTLHPPLPFPDEGAANHIRFCSTYESKGTHLYVYDRHLFRQEPHLFPARQTREASEAIARLHGGIAVFAKQNPALIEKGVFHNDVISCGNRHVFLYHDEAFVNTQEVIGKIQSTCPLQLVRVEIPVERAIKTYLFNSQLLTLPNQTQLLLAPEECQELSLEWLPFPTEFVSLKQSMENGGGPACLRLAIPLTDEEIQKVHQPIFLTPSLYQNLKEWIEKHYRDHLTLNDLRDPSLLTESHEAFESLSALLELNFLY